jgi:dihydroorotate dehydrogenase (fumarate)
LADISVDYLGLKLSSPVVAAPSASTGTMDLVRVAEDSGVGAIVMRTLYPRSDQESVPPHFEIIKHNIGTMRSTTLYSSEHAALWDPDRYAEEIRTSKEHVKIPIIASIGCISPSDWVVKFAKLVEHAGADALELNMHCPNVVRGEEFGYGEMMSDVISLVKSTVKIPIIPKMTPQLENPTLSAMALEKAGADGVVMFGRFTGLEIDIDQEQPISRRAYAWHGGPWSIFYSLRWINGTYQWLGIPIAGCGGVATAEDVVKYLLVGATVVQSCTAIITQGYQIVKDLNQGLKDWMDRKGYQRPEDFRGKIARQELA